MGTSALRTATGLARPFSSCSGGAKRTRCALCGREPPALVDATPAEAGRDPTRAAPPPPLRPACVPLVPCLAAALQGRAAGAGRCSLRIELQLIMVAPLVRYTTEPTCCVFSPSSPGAVDSASPVMPVRALRATEPSCSPLLL